MTKHRNINGAIIRDDDVTEVTLYFSKAEYEVFWHLLQIPIQNWERKTRATLNGMEDYYEGIVKK